MKWIKRLFCRHKGTLTFVRNIYGDEIRHSDYKRSLWSCDKCFGLVLKPDLNEPSSPMGKQLEATGQAPVTSGDEK